MTDPENIRSSLNPSDTPLFSFGMISDIQYCNCDAEGTRFYRQSLKKLESCVDDLNSKELSFVVNLGDLIDRDFNSYDTVLKILDQLDFPVYHVLGNHDFLVTDHEKTRISSKLDISDTYYDFEIQGWRFIILNGCEISLFATSENTREYRKAKRIYYQLKINNAHHAIDWNGAVSRDQFTWLKKKIKTSEEQGEKVILFCHFPVYPKMVHNLWNYTSLLRLFGRHDHIKAYFNGHNHSGSFGTYKKTPCITLAAMVETPDETAYSIVEVFKNRLEITGIGREKTRILHFIDQ